MLSSYSYSTVVTLFVNLPYPKKQNLHDLKETKKDKKNKYSCLPSNNDAVKWSQDGVFGSHKWDFR